MKKFLFILTLLFAFYYVDVFAEVSCPYNVTHDLNTEVSHIKVKYEIKQEYTSEGVSGCDRDGECTIRVDYFDVQILNMSENFYVEVTNNYNKDKLTLHYADADEDGIIHFKHPYVMEKVTYTLSFYASAKTGCLGNKIKSYTKAFPRKNPYYYYEMCEEIPDSDICQEYVFFDDIEFSSFYKIANSEIEEKTNKSKGNEDDRNVLDKIIDFMIDNKWLFIGGAAGIVVVGFAISFSRKRKQDEKDF